MFEEINDSGPITAKPVRFRFHPIVRYFMIVLSTIATCYSLYFITYLIPRIEDVPIFFKLVSIVVLYISLSTLYKHLSSLNSVIVNNDEIILGFILRKKIVIPWQNLVGMEIFKVITHYLKVIYIDNRNVRKVFKTSLAFPGIINLLLMIQDNKPDVELNELLKQVLIFKRTQL